MQNAVTCSGEGLVYGCMRRNIKNNISFIRLKYMYSVWSLLGLKKAWAMPRLLFFRGVLQNFRRASLPLHMGTNWGHPTYSVV